ncbi:hypothetical protein PDESU_05603 [Pontiella desulfatans]|uniref:Asl1-like glycosyl hydrolase catalytic domain-containing protein n=2 Tax=Pontiella desulfatans TaxID=2750659 RepID=A0A6C2UAT3_PONDE|nr:hypothetical protein PDESU_05603 [Pontiella desulfatans]
MALLTASSLAAGGLKETVVKGGSRSLRQVNGWRIALEGETWLTLEDAEDPILRGEIDFRSPDAWVSFPALRPSEVNERFLRFLKVRGVAAKVGENVRLAPHVGGTLVIPHGPDYPALQTYERMSFGGGARSFKVHAYHRAKELGKDDDRIMSFVLKKGYMATLAENGDGSGASQVFIARDADLRVSKLPNELVGKVSFVRVFPWNWTAKKGFGGKLTTAEKLGAHWKYDWSANGESTLDMEFVPMRHNKSWDSFSKINAKQNVTHLLGFNEPMQKDQGNMTLEQCLDMWPKLQASGLRLGSPCPTDGKVDWLYEFIEKADERGLRVDFVAVHYYKANWSAEKLVGWLRAIHERTGRPIWLTEFNNGASWTKNHNPSPKENAKRIEEYCEAMEKADFIERYAVFNLGDKAHHRQVIIDGMPTPAGESYREVVSTEAYLGE